MKGILESARWPAVGSTAARLGRAEWGIAFLGANWISGVARGALQALALDFARSLKASPKQAIVALILVHLVVLVLTLAFQRRISIKRARDRNARPFAFWAYAAATVVLPIPEVVEAMGLRMPFDVMWIWLATVAAWVWIAVDLGLRRGDKGPNRWGPEPKRYIQTAFGKVDNYRAPRP